MSLSLLLLLPSILPRVLATAADEYSHLSPTSIANLEEIAQQKGTSTTISLFSIPTFVLWCCMYFSAQGTEWALGRYTKSFKVLSFANQRTCVMYVLNIFYTTVAFGIQLGGYQMLYDQYTVIYVECLKITAIMVSVLYLFELTYRPAMRAQMLTHHFCTLFITFFLFACAQETQNPSIFVTALCWLFQATTEQGIFVGLLMYRFRGSPTVVPNVLRIAAAQALVVKFAFSIYVFVWWGERQISGHTTPLEIAYSVIVVLSMSVLMFTQFYGSWIVWKLAGTYAQKFQAWNAAEDDDARDKSSRPASGAALTSTFVGLETPRDSGGFQEGVEQETGLLLGEWPKHPPYKVYASRVSV